MSAKERLFKIRFKIGDKLSDIFINANNGEQAIAKARPAGKILSVRKVSTEEILKSDDKFLKRILTPDPALFSLDKLFGKIDTERKANTNKVL